MQTLQFHYEIQEGAGWGINRETGERTKAYIAVSFSLLHPFADGVYQLLHEQKIPLFLHKQHGLALEHVTPISLIDYQTKTDDTDNYSLKL